MILDMIQGCRYLRRSTDRWLLSKNSTTRLKDSKDGTGPVCCEIVRYLLQTLRVHIYTLVLTRLLVDHDYNIYSLKLMPRRQCLPRTRHQFVPSLCSSHVITHSRMLPLPSVKQLSCVFNECFEENLLPNGCWWIKLVSTYDPQAYGPTPFSPRDSQGSC
jgi:hypothetical protein